MTELKKDKESGLPLEMKTPKGTILPLMVMDRSSHVKWCKDKPCKGKPDHWTKTYQNYLQVAHRLVWFREEHPDWAIETEFVKLENNIAIARARIFDSTFAIISSSGATGEVYERKPVAMATKQENSQGFPDFIEKAETGAVGRALAMCGYGTQFSPDMDEGDRLADSPTAQRKAPAKAKASPKPQPAPRPERSGPEVTTATAFQSPDVAPEPSGQAGPKTPQSAPRREPAPVAVSATSPGPGSSGGPLVTPVEGLSLGLQTKLRQNAARAGYLVDEGRAVEVPMALRDLIGRPKSHRMIGLAEPMEVDGEMVKPLNTAEAAMLAGLYFREPQTHGAVQSDMTAEAQSMLSDK